MYPEQNFIPDNTPKEEIIDIQKIIRRLLNFWLWFVISILLALSAAYTYNLLSTPSFRAGMTILIKEDQGSLRRSPNLVSSLDVFGSQTNLYNEIGIIRSLRLNYKTVEDLGLYIAYNKVGKYRAKDVYSLCPFIIIPDTSHYQALNTEVRIQIKSSTQVRITCKFNQPFRAAKYSTGDILTMTADNSYNRTYDIGFNELFETPFFSFRVLPVDNITSRNINDEYSIVFQDIQNVANSFRSRISVEPINKESTIIRISLVDAIPVRALDYLNRLGSNYINMGLNEKNLIATRTIDFIDEQLSGITDTLSVIEKDLEQFRTENEVIDLSTQGTAIYQKLQTLEYEKSLEKMNVGYYEYLLNYVKTDTSAKELISPTTIGVNNSLLIELTSDLSQLYATREQLRATSSPKNPYLNEINIKIEMLRRTLVENVTQLLNNSRFLLSEKQKEINRVQAELQKLPQTERQLISIKRMFTVNDQIYTFLLQKRAEAAISRASSIADHKIIDSAISESRIRPKKSQNYMIAFIIGLLVPAAFIILHDLIRNTIKDISDIESLTKIPVLGNVLHYDGEELNINSIDASVAESFRVIRTNLDFFVAEKERKVITLTSMHSSEGKSFCSMHLAYVFALTGKKTILIGADIRKPDLGKMFNINKENGLSSFLSRKNSWEEVVYHSEVENLDYVNPGIVPPNPAELLSDQNISRIFENLENYDIIIFDTSPLGIIADAAYIVRHSDVNLFVTRYYVTRKPNVKMINYIINKLKVQNPAIICNDFRRRSSKYYYYYYYSKMKVKGDHYYSYTQNQNNNTKKNKKT
jgi:tyrosine-protein kinase Etk/Wzc